ncbi:PqqD family protein [Phytomonospora endophytica]|uniref:PqqD family protein n=1 Tax=Phytomonospora endophytica TaxID=714109 RepID=A0A841FKN0_9ACTN|nr:PqqD family protein [Phytomonospora endophytica]MBB6037891.1 hypothetical protein [Phytomonospora endophytica]GIG68791.1 hypothetical protein Pen01_50860 [Phytomonospora endophytica]
MSNPWIIAEQIVWSADSGEIRLYDALEGTFQTLNASGTAIWELVVEGLGTEEIAARLSSLYGEDDEAERKLIAEDVHAFLADLATRGVVSPATAAAP